MAATAAERERLLTRVDAVESMLEPLLRRSLKRVVRKVMSQEGLPSPAQSTKTLTAAATPDKLLTIISLWQHEVEHNISPGFLKAIEKASGWTLRRLGVADSFIGANVRDIRSQALLGTIENRIKGVGDTMYHEATSALRVALENGEGVDKAAARVSHSLNVSAGRARTIARTEAAAVVNGADAGISQELQQAGITHVVEWLSTPGDRTRKTHKSANGQRIVVGEKFQVGRSRLAYPGDPNGSAEEVINCRCTTLLDVDAKDIKMSLDQQIEAQTDAVAEAEAIAQQAAR